MRITNEAHRCFLVPALMAETAISAPPPAEQSVHSASPPTPLRCIVKLGGAAVTKKGELESIDEEHLSSACAQLREAMTPGATISMDWSRRPGDTSDPVVPMDELGKTLELCSGMHESGFIVIHGAGSFGHFQASKSGVHRGGLDLPVVKAGFVATRISVTSLNLEIVRALAREGIPSVGISPFACGWTTLQRNIVSADATHIIDSLSAGFVPVMHGDAVLDNSLGCTILSGDVILRHLAKLLMPRYVVFLTDVFGVYDRPPSDRDAILLKEIEVSDDGSWSIVNPSLLRNEVEITVAAHDTTGGMETKIAEAAAIAKHGIKVYITKVGTEHSLRALKGDVGDSSEEWLGTIIRAAK